MRELLINNAHYVSAEGFKDVIMRYGLAYHRILIRRKTLLPAEVFGTHAGVGDFRFWQIIVQAPFSLIKESFES